MWYDFLNLQLHQLQFERMLMLLGLGLTKVKLFSFCIIFSVYNYANIQKNITMNIFFCKKLYKSKLYTLNGPQAKLIYKRIQTVPDQKLFTQTLITYNTELGHFLVSRFLEKLQYCNKEHFYYFHNSSDERCLQYKKHQKTVLGLQFFDRKQKNLIP